MYLVTRFLPAPQKLILPGMSDRATADMLSKMSGEYDRMTISVNQPGRTFGHSGATRLSSSTTQPSYSYHTHRTPVLTIADISGIPSGQGLYYGPRGWDRSGCGAAIGGANWPSRQERENRSLPVGNRCSC